MKTAHRPSGPGSDIRNNIPAPPGLDVSNISRRDSSIDDDEDEEEMVSLGLSRDGSLQLAADSHDDSLDDGDGGSQTQNNSIEPNISLMVGTNRKSAFPATPATPVTAAAVNNNRMSSLQQQAAGGGGGAPIRRTPGPGLSVAHQARHRRTPGAGAQQQHTVSNFVFHMTYIWGNVVMCCGMDKVLGENLYFGLCSYDVLIVSILAIWI